MVDSVWNMANMFEDASAFDQDLGWCLDDGVDLKAWHSKTRRVDALRHVDVGAAATSRTCRFCHGVRQSSESARQRGSSPRLPPLTTYGHIRLGYRA